MLRRVALVTTDISEKRIPSIIRVPRIGELVTANVVPNSPFLVTTRRHIPGEGILSTQTCNTTYVDLFHSTTRNSFSLFLGILHDDDAITAPVL
jgi:hypothetical protein